MDNLSKYTLILAIATVIMAGMTACQAWESKRMIDLTIQQTTPKINIEINSQKIPIILEEHRYYKANYFDVYTNNIIKNPDGSLSGDVALPLNITIYNMWNNPVKLEGMKYIFYCDNPIVKNDLQVDIIKDRFIKSEDALRFDHYLFVHFYKIPIETKDCQLDILFNFGEFEKSLTYFVHYNNYNNTYPH